MPSSFQGFGTTFYGKRDFAPDGSYVTTEWMIFAFIPILPVSTFRVLETGWHQSAFRSRTDYVVIKELPLNRRQVCCVWGFTAFYFCWMITVVVLLLSLGFLEDRRWGGLVLMSVGCLPFLIPSLLRYHKKKALLDPSMPKRSIKQRLLLGILMSIPLLIGLALGFLRG